MEVITLGHAQSKRKKKSKFSDDGSISWRAVHIHFVLRDLLPRASSVVSPLIWISNSEKFDTD